MFYKLSFIYIIVKIIGEIDVYIRFQLTFFKINYRKINV